MPPERSTWITFVQYSQESDMNSDALYSVLRPWWVHAKNPTFSLWET